MAMPIILSEPVKETAPAKEISTAEIPVAESAATKVVERLDETPKETS